MIVEQTVVLLIQFIKDGTEVIEALEERLVGRYARKAIKHPETNEVSCS